MGALSRSVSRSRPARRRWRAGQAIRKLLRFDVFSSVVRRRNPTPRITASTSHAAESGSAASASTPAPAAARPRLSQLEPKSPSRYTTVSMTFFARYLSARGITVNSSSRAGRVRPCVAERPATAMIASAVRLGAATSTAMPRPCTSGRMHSTRPGPTASRISGPATTSWSTSVTALTHRSSVEKKSVRATRLASATCTILRLREVDERRRARGAQHVADDRGEIRRARHVTDAIERAALDRRIVVGGLDRPRDAAQLRGAEHRELEQRGGQHEDAGDCRSCRRAASSAAGPRTRRSCRRRRSGRTACARSRGPSRSASRLQNTLTTNRLKTADHT